MAGPKPQYQPRFKEDDLQRCRDIVRQRNAPHGHVQRARLALLLSEHPELSVLRVAAKLGMGSNFVWKWRKRWALGPFTLEDRARTGRPRNRILPPSTSAIPTSSDVPFPSGHQGHDPLPNRPAPPRCGA